MALWSNVQSGFDINDETINFGTRIIAENNGSLYEACTLATIQSFEKIKEQPNVIASLQHSKICVAIDKSITVFADETCDKILCNISFPSMIVSYCISKDGFFLFVVLINRILYCLQLSSGNIVFSKTISDNENDIIDIFLKEQDEETFIILVTNIGTIYKFHKFSLKILQTAFINDDKIMIAKCIADIQCSQMFKEFTSRKFVNAVINTSSEELSIIMVGKNSIFTWPNEQYIDFQSVCSFGCKKIKPLYDSNKMLCLRTDNTLNMICMNTFLMLKICDTPVFDFTVIQYTDHCDILFLTYPKDSCTTVYMLRVISYPDFEQKLEINVPNNTYLLDILHSSESLFYIEGIISESGITEMFRIKMITESCPDIRLARLLKRKQFEAAETFAKKFNLSMESIYCCKAALFMEQLSPWTKSVSELINLDTLLDVLDKIQDIQYVIECCSKIFISDYTEMKRIYSYAQQRVTRYIQEETMNDSLNASLSLMNDILRRLETLQMIQDVETDVLLIDDEIMQERIRFLQADLLEECISRLSMNQLKSATLIWTRHLPDFIKHVSMETVQNIFTILLDKEDSSYLWSCLSHFIPTLLSLLPDALNEIIAWSLKRLKYLETCHSSVWPEIGKEYAEKLIKVLKFEDNQLVYFHQEYKYQNSLLKQFMILFQALSDIQQLKTVYRLRIPLDIYTDSPEEAIHLLLNEIQIDQIPNFVNTFVQQYMLNNNLQNDAIFCTYIQKTIERYNWWFNEEVAWEEKISVIISLIHNIEKRLQQTLIVLRKASVPWSSIITTLAETSINENHSLSSKIKIECDSVPIKLILMKYGYALIGVNDRLILRIIKENYDSMIDDIEVLTKNNQRLRQDAFCRCINTRLNEKNLQKAMDIIDYLEKDVATVLYCYEGIVQYIIASFSFQDAITSLIGHMEILGCLKLKIYNLLRESNVCPYRCNNIIKTITDLKSLFTLKKCYGVDISLKDYYTKKSLVLQNYISKLLLDTKDSDWIGMYEIIIKVAELLELDKLDAVLFMLEQMKSLKGLEQLVDYNQDLDLMSEKFKNIYKICISILKHSAININAVKLVKHLSVSLVNTCQDNDLQSALMLYTCVSAHPTFFTQNYYDVEQEFVMESTWKLYTIYKDQAISLSEKLLSLFKDAISLYLYYSNQINNNEILRFNEEMDQLLFNFLGNTKKMQPQLNDYALLQIFKTFYFILQSTYIKNENILTEMNSTLSHLSMNLLKKMCSGRSFDSQLGLSCLFLLSEDEAYNWLCTTSTSFQMDPIRHRSISFLGYEYLRLKQNQSLIVTFENYKLLHIWAQRLSHYSITFKQVLTNNASSKREILQQIINSNKDNMIPLLKDYCCSFGFNFNDCLLLYLQNLLKTWNPTITVSDGSINKELLICKEEVDELRRKCNTIVAEMEDASVLKQCLCTLWENISFYHYEVFIILMDLMEEKNMKKRNYLCFLQNYIRNGLPTMIEYDEWKQLNSEHNTLPPIAQWRLPFLLKIDIWKIITPELNLKTYDQWLSIAPVLNLESRLVCTLAIKGEITRIWENNPTMLKDTTWMPYMKNTTLLEDIKKCIQRMSDSDRFYYGTAALYYVVNHTPPGADRVAAARECFDHAQLAAQNSTKFEEGMLEKIKSKYLRFTAEYILHTYGLEKDKYLALIQSPCKLVYELYNDESIPLRYRTVTNYRPDINAAVNELGELFSLNMIKLRMNLLEEWLQSNSTESQDFTGTFMAMKEFDNIDCEDNLLRICYMLEYGDTNLFAQFLINIGFDNHDYGETEYNYNVRYRVCRILQNVIDTTSLEELIKQDASTFKKYMKSLQYIGKLESLGLSFTIDTFETCCKLELVQILLKTQRRLPCAISVIAQICIEYEINDILVWNDTLNGMTNLQMINDLKKVLLQLRNKCVIVDCDSYKMGWQLIISKPFDEMDVNPNLQQIDNCVEAICLLYSCPITHELNFTAIIKHCFRSKQAHLAAALLPFLNKSEKEFVLEVVNKKCQIKEIIKDLNNLSSKGVLTVTHSLTMIQKSNIK